MGGLCIEVSDRDALQTVLDPIYLRGVILVSMIKPLPPNMRSGHVGFDDAEIGTTLADTTAKVFEERGTVMLLHSGKKNPIYGARLEALEKQLAMYPDIEVFAEVDCQMDAVQARRLMRERSERYPRLSAWISVEDWPLQHFGELDTIMPPACKFITFGGTPAHWPMIRSGQCPAMVAGNYNDLGAKAVQFCEGAMHKTSSFQTVYHAPLRVIWASHLDDYITDWTYWTGNTTETRRDGVD
jgi:ABC-type sugar transport system substrate-binding protein